MRRGFILRSSVGLRPSFSRTPGRNGSMRTSHLEMRERRSWIDGRDFRSSAMEDL